MRLALLMAALFVAAMSACNGGNSTWGECTGAGDPCSWGACCPTLSCISGFCAITPTTATSGGSTSSTSGAMSSTTGANSAAGSSNGSTSGTTG